MFVYISMTKIIMVSVGLVGLYAALGKLTIHYV